MLNRGLPVVTGQNGQANNKWTPEGCQIKLLKTLAKFSRCIFTVKIYQVRHMCPNLTTDDFSLFLPNRTDFYKCQKFRKNVENFVYFQKMKKILEVS